MACIYENRNCRLPMRFLEIYLPMYLHLEIFSSKALRFDLFASEERKTETVTRTASTNLDASSGPLANVRYVRMIAFALVMRHMVSVFYSYRKMYTFCT